uniref:Uncharacterized protein n=1 Tax=Rhizophora mucronata TaxID=61149 RepID=A0A2P2QUZ2_RHIMU
MGRENYVAMSITFGIKALLLYISFTSIEALKGFSGCILRLYL